MYASQMERQAKRWKPNHRTADDYSTFTKLELSVRESQLRKRIRSIQPTIKLLAGELSLKQSELGKLYKELHSLQQQIVPIQKVSLPKTKTQPKAEDIAMLNALSAEEFQALITEVKEAQ